MTDTEPANPDESNAGVNALDTVMNAPFGHAEITVDVDEDTYQRAHAAYLDVLEHGYPEGFETFLMNHATSETTITVDGEPVDPEGE